MRKYMLINVAGFLIIMVMYILKRHYIPSSSIFYEGIFFSVCLGVIIQVVIFIFIDKKIIILSAILAMILITSLIPTIVDRSVSVSVLKIVSVCNGCSKEIIETKFIGDYIGLDDAINKRLDEQLFIKNIKYDENNYLLTPRGRITLKIIEAAKKTFNIQ